MGRVIFMFSDFPTPFTSLSRKTLFLYHVKHKSYFPQVKDAYVNFLTHCYIDTEVEMKEIYTSNHMWQLFERSFLLDMGVVSNATHDRKHADVALENYVTETLMDIITTFFKSPFSDQSTTVQVS